MQIPKDAVLLQIFFGENDEARSSGLASALKGWPAVGVAPSPMNALWSAPRSHFRDGAGAAAMPSPSTLTAHNTAARPTAGLPLSSKESS